jgi:effector-binding domain-containing protein
MQNKCEFLEKPAQPVLSIRTRTTVDKLPQVLGYAYEAIMQYLGEIGEQPSDAPFAAYYNMDMQDLDIEAGFPVMKPIAGKGEIAGSEIPAGKQAVCIYKGPYSQCEAAYNDLTQWMQENGHIPVGTAYEFYLNSPEDTPESELLTRIMFPLK